MARLLGRGAVAFAALLLLAPHAFGRERVVVLDRGRGAKAEGKRWDELALRLHASARDATLVVYGTRPDGRSRAGVVKRDPAATIADAATREGWSWEGPTDARGAVEAAFARREVAGPIDLFLVGPFADEVAERVEGLAAWRERAPQGSRLWPVGLGAEALERLAGAAGLVTAGAVVLAVGAPAIEARAFSPLARPVRLEAQGSIVIDRVTVGAGPPPALLELTCDGAEVSAEPVPEGLRVSLAGRAEGPRRATLHVRARADAADVLVLADLPAPTEVVWDRLERDARLEDEAGAAPASFDAPGLRADRPRVAAWRLLATQGPGSARPVWQARGRDAPLPPGLEVEFGEAAAPSDEVLATWVTVRARATAGRALDARGVLVLEEVGGEFRFEVPYHVEVPPGQVRVRLVAPGEPQALPRAEGDPPWRVEVEALDANVPEGLDVALEVDPPEALERFVEWLVHQGAEVRSPHARLRVPREGLSLFPACTGAPWEHPVEATFRLVLPEQAAVVGEASGVARARTRRPRLRWEGPEARYRLEGSAVVSQVPLRLRLDADGGDAAWRGRLLEAPVTLLVPPSAPVGFALELEAPGLWRLATAGRWQAERGGVFHGRRDRVRLEVRWARGEVPAPMDVEIDVPPRWGRAGWILVGLAGIAVLVGGVAASHLRCPPLRGTLLYALAGREGVVGHLDLAPAGRRAAKVASDEQGRLALGGAGPTVAILRPTRVGGFLDLDGPSGRERHLLVDGLTVVSGRHHLRYVSGQGPQGPALPPAAVEDLLGPEYDLPTGRIARLGSPPPRPDATAPEARAPDGAGGRS